MPKFVTRDELHRLMVDGAGPTLIEALPEKYYVEGRLPRAKHLPHDQVGEKAAAVVPNKDAAIVVYCTNTECRNSYEAAATLEALGYKDVAVYPGGKSDWREAGFKLETG